LSIAYIDSIQQKLANHRTEFVLSYAIALFGFYAIYFLSLSVQYSDSDLWYHLTGGRHFFSEGALYNPYVNSYLTDKQEFINYFWGFQATVYAVWSFAGEFGLILLKALIFMVSGYFVSRIILGDDRLKTATFLQLIVITAVIGILCARGFSLRPHVFSYAFIPIFIFILSHRERYYPLLPLLTIFWVNLHGVEYVIGGLICGAFFLQRLIDYLLADTQDIAQLRPLLWVALCLPAMMLNPNGVYILLTPFVQDPGLGLFISELEPFALDLTFELNDGISTNSLMLVIAFFTIAALFLSLNNFRHHIAPVILACGALVLLIMAKRFVWEWTLLSVPLIAVGLSYWHGPGISLRTGAILMATLVLLPVSFWPTIRTGWQHYPFNDQSLPYGTSQFILTNGIEGKYALEPSYAGYAEFILAPKIKIHMDMQFPPFDSLNYQELATAMLSASGLATYVGKHRPDLIGVRKTNKHFPDIAARELGYTPVFFDKKVVLYLNEKIYPKLADAYELNAINPFAQGTIRKDQLDNGIIELEQMLALVDTTDVKLTLVGLLMEKRDIEKARHYMEELQTTSPHDVATLYSYARVEHLSGHCANAVDAYEQAIALAEDSLPMHLFAGECYFLLGEHHRAYEHFSKSINPYADPTPNSLSYFQYALSAVGIGKDEHARRLLTMIHRFDPDGELQDQVNQVLVIIGKEP